jgi:hypothetical protein
MCPLNISDPEFTFDPEDPDGFRAGMFRLGDVVGAERTGTDKVGLWLGPGDSLMVERSSGVDYYRGEKP